MVVAAQAIVVIFFVFVTDNLIVIVQIRTRYVQIVSCQVVIKIFFIPSVVILVFEFFFTDKFGINVFQYQALTEYIF